MAVSPVKPPESAAYTPNPLGYSRRKTRVVMVGDVGVGGDNPIRVQSMTTTLTKDIGSTVAQADRLARAGCEIVRITTPTPDDARCLKVIRKQLASRGVHVPLVADIHFSPMAAMVAAEFADKVRVNPGNYVDSRKFAVREYTDQQYTEEVERAAERFTPLVLKCKELGRAMRIGTNHGSLSDRIMNRFGDTPEGMAESALEFVRVCEDNGYYDVILSMKASNPKVMIAAYRLLATRMYQFNMEYPFHLGVTEAGNAEDGRIKSAIGIGSLLEDGIGDTIRVSLTEEPEEEIPVAFAIARRYPKDGSKSNAPSSEDRIGLSWDPIHYSRRKSKPVSIGSVTIGGSEQLAVACGVKGPVSQVKPFPALLRWASPAGRRQPKPEMARVELETEADVEIFATIPDMLHQFPMASLEVIGEGSDPALLAKIAPQAAALAFRARADFVVSAAVRELAPAATANGIPVILVGVIEDAGFQNMVETVLALEKLLRQAGVETILSLEAPERLSIHAYRLLAIRANQEGIKAPVLILAQTPAGESGVDRLLGPSTVVGSLLCDGIGDAVELRGDGDLVSLAFNILQASGARISKTDYVACPSCGRTLFDLQETTERIKARTSHLVGVKLAIMGCIVNGPGEMADADFGYVGGAPGKVNLYVGKECVEKGVPAEVADDRLIELIKSHGKWMEDEDEAQVDAGAEAATVVGSRAR